MGDSTVNILSGASPVSKKLIIKKYLKVFHRVGVGQLEGEYSIQLDPKMDPVKYVPR